MDTLAEGTIYQLHGYGIVKELQHKEETCPSLRRLSIRIIRRLFLCNGGAYDTECRNAKQSKGY